MKIFTSIVTGLAQTPQRPLFWPGQRSLPAPFESMLAAGKDSDVGLRDIPLRMMSGMVRRAYKEGARALDEIPKIEPGGFKDLVSSKEPVLVEFFAGWCGPCYVMAPSLLEFARERPDVRVVKLDAQEQPSMAADLQVQGLPTLILFGDGIELLRMTGAQSKQDLLDRVREALGQ